VAAPHFSNRKWALPNLEGEPCRPAWAEEGSPALPTPVRVPASTMKIKVPVGRSRLWAPRREEGRLGKSLIFWQTVGAWERGREEEL